MNKHFIFLIFVFSLFLFISCGSPSNSNPGNTPDPSTDVIPDDFPDDFPVDLPVDFPDETSDVSPDVDFPLELPDESSDVSPDVPEEEFPYEPPTEIPTVPSPDTTTVSNYIGEMTFTTNSNDTVTQMPLNITWKRVDEALAANIEDAKTACTNLGISSDGTFWRLPTIFEFISVTDYSVFRDFDFMSGIPPQVNEASLNLTGGAYWTDSASGSNQFIYDPSGGDISTSPGAGGEGLELDVRCVSGTAYNKDRIYPNNRWQSETLLGDIIVRDSITGLQWEYGVSDEFAIDGTPLPNCADKQVAGLSGWRVPTLKELLSLIDLSKNTFPYINNVFSQDLEALLSYDINLGQQEFFVDFENVSQLTPFSAFLASGKLKCVHD